MGITVGKVITTLGGETLREMAPWILRGAGPILEKVGSWFGAATGAMTDGAARVATSTAVKLYERSNLQNEVEMAKLDGKNVRPRSNALFQRGPSKAPDTARVLDSSQIRTVNRKQAFAAALVIGQIVAGISLIAVALTTIATTFALGGPIVIPVLLWIGLALIANGAFTSHLEEQLDMDKFTDSNKLDAFAFAALTPLASIIVLERWLTNPNRSALAEAHANN